MTDDRWRNWLPLLRSGDVLVRDHVFNAYFQYVFSALMNISSNLNSKWNAPLAHPRIAELAEELTGLAFAQAFARIDKFDETKSALPTWIVWQGRSQLKGIVLKEIREASRLDPGSHDDFDALAVGVNESTHDPAEDAVEQMMAERTSRTVWDILNGMAENHRRALVLAYLQLAPNTRSASAAIAEDLGLSIAAAESLLRRAIKEFRNRWKERLPADALES